MNPVDDAIERAEKHPFHPIYEDWPDRQTLAAEVKRLREEKHVLIQTLTRVETERDGLRMKLHEAHGLIHEVRDQLADCRKGITRWPRDT